MTETLVPMNVGDQNEYEVTCAARAVIVQRLLPRKDAPSLKLRDLLSEVILALPGRAHLWLPVTLCVIEWLDLQAGRVSELSEQNAENRVLFATQNQAWPHRVIGWIGKYLSFNSLNSYICRTLSVTKTGTFVAGAIVLAELEVTPRNQTTVAVFMSPRGVADSQTLENPNVFVTRVTWAQTARLMNLV